VPDKLAWLKELGFNKALFPLSIYPIAHGCPKAREEI